MPWVPGEEACLITFVLSRESKVQDVCLLPSSIIFVDALCKTFLAHIAFVAEVNLSATRPKDTVVGGHLAPLEVPKLQWFPNRKPIFCFVVITAALEHGYFEDVRYKDCSEIFFHQLCV